jgi:hypothetical protein
VSRRRSNVGDQPTVMYWFFWPHREQARSYTGSV